MHLHASSAESKPYPGRQTHSPFELHSLLTSLHVLEHVSFIPTVWKTENNYGFHCFDFDLFLIPLSIDIKQVSEQY